MAAIDELASYRRCVERIGANWQAFQDQRAARLRERERFGHSAERAVEGIIEDLFAMVLDWSIGDINHQVGYADILLTRLGIKHLIVETKRPESLAWNRRAVDRALEQACRYAAEQKVRCVAVSDGTMIYAADVSHGGLSDRVFCSIAHPEPQAALWWLSMDGVYRERSGATEAQRWLLPEEPSTDALVLAETSGDRLLHPKYKLPARCFAYAGDAGDTRTWRLPYLNEDGSVDAKRLPKAVQAILSNYRGAHLSSIPEADIPDVLVRLACAAGTIGKLPTQTAQPASAYVSLAAAIEQFGKWEAVKF